MTRKAPRKKLNVIFGIHSTDRRNVDKHIIRYMITRYGHLREQIISVLRQSHYINKDFDQVDRIMTALKEKEASKSVRHDYTTVIDRFLSNMCFTLLMKVCITDSINEQGKVASALKEPNRLIYTSAKNAYLRYIDENL